MKSSSIVFRSLCSIVAVSAMFAFLSNTPATAQNESPVQVSGTVKDSTGKAVAGVNVSLFKVNVNPGQDIGGARGGGGGGGGKRDAFGTPETIELQNKIGQKVAQVASDANGVYTFKSVKPGNYRYQAGNAKTTGYMGGTLEVAAGQNMTFDIALQPPQR